MFIEEKGGSSNWSSIKFLSNRINNSSCNSSISTISSSSRVVEVAIVLETLKLIGDRNSSI